MVHEICQKQVTVTTASGPAPAPGTVNLAWAATTTPHLSGYRIYHGSSSRTYAQTPGNGINVGNRTSYTISGLNAGQKIYFTVTAVDAWGRESPYANEGSKVIP